jgi:hypothetical protein
VSEKIQASHIEREAYVYIRQSTMQQVRTRLEGQRRQYDLRERAQALGFQRVVVIDEDQGRSGTGSVERGRASAGCWPQYAPGKWVRCWRSKPLVWLGTTATGTT